MRRRKNLRVKSPTDYRQLLELIAKLNHGESLTQGEGWMAGNLLRMIADGVDARDVFFEAVRNRPAKPHLLWVALKYRLLRDHADWKAEAAALEVAKQCGLKERRVEQVEKEYRAQCEELLQAVTKGLLGRNADSLGPKVIPEQDLKRLLQHCDDELTRATPKKSR